MEKLIILGTGMGPDSLSAEARRGLAEAELWFGAPRLLELFKPELEKLTSAGAAGPKTFFPFYRAEEIIAALEGRPEKSAAVLVSGDTGFYSAAPGLYEAFQTYRQTRAPRLALQVIPGIASVSAFCARLGLPWQDAALLSCHGRDSSALAGTVRRHRRTFCLTGNNAAALGEALCRAGYGGLTVHTGENLGSAEERLQTVTAEELSRLELPSLSALLIVNDDPDDRIRFGLNDDAFDRGEGVPMTKSEIRAIALAALGLRPGDICYDVGAGTGSVAVEMALAAYRGRVYAIERRNDALPLILRNARRFHLGNVTVVEGSAPAALEGLPAPDAVFIGGSGGSLGEIVSTLRSKNPRVRVVITAITLETAAAALSALPGAELTQVFAARAKKAGESRLLVAQNPVMIISAGGTP
jgi:precorrin-6Y C5,15-methyltransferase (decarboxylating)